MMAENTEREPVDPSVYLDKAPTTLQARFGDWIQDTEVGVGYDPSKAKTKQEAFLEGVRLATATRMVFQASDYNRQANAEERAARQQARAEAAAEKEQAEEAPKPKSGKAKAAPAKSAPAKKTAPAKRAAKAAPAPAPAAEETAPAPSRPAARRAPARRASAATEAPF